MENSPFSSYSDAEQAYAVSQLDPFHDAPYRLSGAPSDQSTDSVVITVNQEVVVGAASFGLPVASGGKWDLHVSALPLSQSALAYEANAIVSNFYTTGASAVESPTQRLYPISLSANTTGLPTFCQTTPSLPILGVETDVTSFQGTGSAVVNPRVLRVIGSSFEVVDESPTLYQQGACTVYTRPSTMSQTACFINQATPFGAAVNNQFRNLADSFQGPPNRIEHATILQSSKTWKASEGAYVIARKNVDCPPFIRPGISNFLMTNPTDPSVPSLRNCYFGREGFNAQIAPTNTANADSFCFVTPYNVSGAYLTGLNSEFGTYRVRTKLIYEIIPAPVDTTLVSQSTPTVPRNPSFESLLEETISRLPAGVPQSMNPKGEFWKIVKKTAGTALRTLSPALSAYNPAMGMGAEMLANEMLRKKKVSKVPVATTKKIKK